MVNTLLVSTVLAGLISAQPGGAPNPPSGDPAKSPASKAPATPRPARPADPPRVEAKPLTEVNVGPKELEEAVTRGIEILLSMQEDDPNKPGKGEGEAAAEWPYEGVYRVGGQIPIGYRVGGTSIAARALVYAPGYDRDPKRQAAVAKALRFVCAQTAHPLMSFKDYTGGYDVRGWGYIYGLELIADLKLRGAGPAGMPVELAAEADRAARFYIQGLIDLEIPTHGGWNYARSGPRTEASAPSPFMTGSALQAIAVARRAGFEFPQASIDRALAYLDRSRGAEAAGRTVVYSGDARPGSERSNGVPGATGRMCVVESTLVLYGKGDLKNVRNAVERFIEHWAELDKRRARSGTHVAPYGVAPYYFMYAHLHAARCVELLPEAERPALREKINKLLFSVRSPGGEWNDRVFPRSAGFGTAMAMLAIGEGTWPAPAQPRLAAAPKATPAATPAASPAQGPAQGPAKSPAGTSAPATPGR